MNRKPTPTLLSRIFTWIYGRPDFRENTFELLDEDHRPRSKCWHEGQGYLHVSHVSDHNPTLGNLATLGNHLSDRINWLLEMIGRINIAQSEIANEINLKLDLAENTLKRLDEQVPTNFVEAFAQVYDDTCEIRQAQSKMFQDMELLNQAIHTMALRLSSIEKAVGAEYCDNNP